MFSGNYNQIKNIFYKRFFVRSYVEKFLQLDLCFGNFLQNYSLIDYNKTEKFIMKFEIDVK
ncbi:hypothetical protein LEP1GSC046_2533 [Leptospira kirschneri serovar Bim str. 1051]|nr:hypothetical protein LEP1GSC042_2633 [Leptospira kirschneri serovar Bim str. PUO 1247]EMN06649.1 hypothetical protein LEP1GSC046_2533 [Leptospira kirschneri serovar Bim str. 1051]